MKINFKQHIYDSLNKAYNNVSNLFGYELWIKFYEMQGRHMTGQQLQHFLNNIVYDGCNYLEVGTHRGATFCAAMYRNTPNKCFTIDNFCQFNEDGDVEEAFNKNINLIVPDLNNHTHINHDCFDIDYQKYNIQDIDIFFFDGPHSENDHNNAIERYYDILSNESIVIIDDWAGSEVRRGTEEAINKLVANKKIENPFYLCAPEFLQSEITNKRCVQNYKIKYGDDGEGWHNGVGIFYIKKC